MNIKILFYIYYKVSALSKLSDMNLAQLMIQKKTTKEEVIPRTISKIDPKSAEVHKEKGKVLMALNRYEEAISCFDKSIQINSNDYVVYNSKGLALNQLEKVRFFF
jgi:Flp pilus assembly protein TadD